jgi:hypothetical protein
MDNFDSKAEDIDEFEFRKYPEVADAITKIRTSISLKDYQPNEIKSATRRRNLLVDISRYVEPVQAISILEGLATEPTAARILGSCFEKVNENTNARKFYEFAEINGDILAKLLLHPHIKEESSASKLKIRIERELDELATMHHPLYEALVASQELEVGNLKGALIHCVNSIAFADPKVERASLVTFSVILECFNRINQELIEAQVDEEDADWLLTDTYSRIHMLLMEISNNNGDGTPWHLTELLQRLAGLFKKELQLGNFSSAGILPEFSDFYIQTMSIYFDKDVHVQRGFFYNQDDGSLVFETDPNGGFGVITPEEVAVALLNACEKGDFLAFNFAQGFFEACNFSLEVLGKYEQEFQEWNLGQYVEG